MKLLHPALAAALVTAVTLTACGTVAAPGGPSGTVTKHWTVTKKRITKYRISVQPDTGGDAVTVRVWRSEYNACANGDHYPDCLTGS